MNLKLKAMILLVIFGAILYLPFSVHAANGNIFKGTPIPILNSLGTDDESAAAETEHSAADGQYNASMDQYAAGLPKPSVPVQVDMNYMRNHMNVLKQEGQSTKQCAACHTNRAAFCDRCHNYVGIKPAIDY